MAARGSRQVVVRWLLVGVAFGYVGLLAAVSFLAKTQTSESGSSYGSTDGAYRSSLTITTEQTLWAAQGAPVAVILGLLTAVVLVGAASLAWRVSHGSARPGVTALVVAGLLGVVAVLGLLSIGIFLIPVVALMVVAGLPLLTFASEAIPAQ